MAEQQGMPVDLTQLTSHALRRYPQTEEVKNELKNRFDERPQFCNVLLEVTNNGRLVTRRADNPDSWVSVRLHSFPFEDGEIRTTTLSPSRAAATNYVMIGAHLTGSPHLTPFPGTLNNPGFSLHGNNGNLYINDTNKAYGKPFSAGDSVTIVVDRPAKRDYFVISYLINHVPVGEPFLFTATDLAIVVSLYSASDAVAITECTSRF